MKPVPFLLVLLACAPALNASDLDNIRLTASFELSAAKVFTIPETVIAEAPAPVVTGAVKGSFCWQRDRDAAADRMGMPSDLCINSMQITGGLFNSPRLTISGDRINGSFELRVGPPADGLHKSTAVIFTKRNGSGCGKGEEARLELSVLADARGMIVAAPYLKAFHSATPDICVSQWTRKEIKYTVSHK